MEKEQQRGGLGGWLILVGLTVLFAPVELIFALISSYTELSRGAWESIMSPNSNFHHRYWIPIFVAEHIFAFLAIIGWVAIAFLFFLKNRMFPRYFVGMTLLTLRWIVLYILAVKLMYSSEMILDTDTSFGILETLLTCAVFIPYMFLSKRVKATFVR